MANDYGALSVLATSAPYRWRTTHESNPIYDSYLLGVSFNLPSLEGRILKFSELKNSENFSV